MSTSELTEIREDDFPSVTLAYDFVLPSYQWLLARYEAADTRLTSLLTTAMAMTAAGPVIGRAIHPSMTVNGWFWTALIAFASTMSVGLWGRLGGAVILPDPTTLYNESLAESPWEFQRRAIFFAGRHFQKNARAIERKHLAAVLVTIGLGLQAACFGIWIAW
jgi:hypothetical protein